MTHRFTMRTNTSEGIETNNTPSRVNPFEFLALVVRRKRLIGGVTLGMMLLAAGITLLIPNHYTSSASILPSGGKDRMAELKNLAGLGNLIGAEESTSHLFPVILRSQSVRDGVINADYEFAHDGEFQRITLPDYFGEENPDKLRRALGDITTISLDKKTGVITLGVETDYPGLSQAVGVKYLAELEAFNLHKRRSEARERAKYLERELAQRRVELAQAEDSLAAFQAANRDWMSTSAPDVAKMLARLEREVEKRTQTYMYLAREYEVAKLDAQKDVPVVRVLDAPTLPTEKSGPMRAAIVLLVGVMTGALVLVVLVGYEVVGRLSRGPDRQGYQTLREEFAREFPRLNRLVARRGEEAAV